MRCVNNEQCSKSKIKRKNTKQDNKHGALKTEVGSCAMEE